MFRTMDLDNDGRGRIAVRKKNNSVIREYWELLMRYFGFPFYWILVQYFVFEKWFLKKIFNSNAMYSNINDGDENYGGRGYFSERGVNISSNRRGTTDTRRAFYSDKREHFSDDENEQTHFKKTEVSYYYNNGNNNGQSSTPVTTRARTAAGAAYRNGSSRYASQQDTNKRVADVTKIVATNSGAETKKKEIMLVYRKNDENIKQMQMSGEKSEFVNKSKIDIDSGFVIKSGSSSVRSNSVYGSGSQKGRKNVWSKYEEEDNEFSEDESNSNESKPKRKLFWILGVIGKILLLLFLLGIVLYLAYLLWPFAVSLIKYISECVTAMVSLTWNGISSVLVLPFTFMTNLKSAVTENIAVTEKTLVPPNSDSFQFQNDKSTIDASISGKVIEITTPSVSKEDYDAILIKLQAIEKTLNVHQEKLSLHEMNYNKLNEKIVLLQREMKAATTRGKTAEQIVVEIMTFKLGETTDGKEVNLNNLMMILTENDATKEHKREEDYNHKIMDIKEKLAADSKFLNDHFDKLDAKVNDLKEHQIRLQMETKKASEMDVDLNKIKEAILPVMINEITQHVKVTCETKDCPVVGATSGSSSNIDVSTEDIQNLIDRAISKYDADKTGRADLALEPAGGSILSTRCTKSSKLRNSVVSLWGFKIWSPPNNPRTIIQPGVVPGECWAFEGSIGDVVIKLISPSIITGFTVEHIAKSVSPYNNIDSAPRVFQVLGLNAEEDLESAHNFGTFTYEDNGQPIQYFEAANITTSAFPIVELKILSNQGNLLHTCLYRFRVHGSLALSGSQFTSTVQVGAEEPEV